MNIKQIHFFLCFAFYATHFIKQYRKVVDQFLIHFIIWDLTHCHTAFLYPLHATYWHTEKANTWHHHTWFLYLNISNLLHIQSNIINLVCQKKLLLIFKYLEKKNGFTALDICYLINSLIVTSPVVICSYHWLFGLNSTMLICEDKWNRYSQCAVETISQYTLWVIWKSMAKHIWKCPKL